jgi:hypothetical protein
MCYVKTIYNILQSLLINKRLRVRLYAYKIRKCRDVIKQFLVTTTARIAFLKRRWKYLEFQARRKYDEREMMQLMRLKEKITDQLRNSVNITTEGKMQILRIRSHHLIIIMDRVQQQFLQSIQLEEEQKNRIDNLNLHSLNCIDTRISRDRISWREKYFHIGSYKKNKFEYFEKVDDKIIEDTIRKHILLKRKLHIQQLERKYVPDTMNHDSDK